MFKKLSRAFLALFIIFFIIAVSLIVCRGLFPLKYYDSINKYCNEYGVETPLALALIKAESNFKENAVSHAGAKGLMQLTDETFDYCTETIKNTSDGDIFSPEENIRAGVWYLSRLLDRYGKNSENAVAAYNAGASNVDKWLNNPDYSTDGKVLEDIPFGETKRHVEKISRYTKIYKFLYPKTRD